MLDHGTKPIILRKRLSLGYLREFSPSGRGAVVDGLDGEPDILGWYGFVSRVVLPPGLPGWWGGVNVHASSPHELAGRMLDP